MNRMIRAATAAAMLTSVLGSVGCVSTGGCGSGGCGGAGGGARGGIGGAREEGHGPIGDCWRNAVDPCYPERYNYAAERSVVGPFAQQAFNGQVLNQTIWNYYFEFGSDTLTPAGIDKLTSIARTRPAPDPHLFIQTARDIPANADPLKIADVRADIDMKRSVAIQKYLASQPAFAGPIAYEVYIHDPVTPGVNAEMVATAYRGSFRGYVGGVAGSGFAVIGTGGGSAPPSTGGGSSSGFGGASSGGAGGGTGGTGGR